ncbi:MAG: cupin domain-containing protein [Xanthobacteraceae bacterium]
MAASQPSRRIVTSHDKDGKAVVHIDDRPPLGAAETELAVTSYLLWATTQTPADLTGKEDAGKMPIGIPPPANGTSFRFVEFAPENETSKKLSPGHMARMLGADHMPGGRPPNHAATHRTRTIDYIIVLSGEIDMVLDDSEVHLTPGDVVVQRGTNHAWVNRGKEPCRIAAILVDAKAL